MIRCAAECESPNNGLICRIVRFVRQYVATSPHSHAHRRVRVEHTIAHLKNWRTLTRHHTRRPILDDTIRAIAGLLSDHQHRAAPAASRRAPVG